MTAADLQLQYLAQLDMLLLDFRRLDGRTSRSNMADLPAGDITHFVTKARAAIYRIAGRLSVYSSQSDDIMHYHLYIGSKARYLDGILRALRDDVEAGYIESHTELVHRELFGDFLEMAQHLLDQGYKDPAAVIAGSSLEAHLRQLCQKGGIEPETEAGMPKKADLLNSELTKADIYSKGDQKNVTAWLDLRNKAAHGHYDQYESGQVRLLIDSVRDFIIRHPA